MFAKTGTSSRRLRLAQILLGSGLLAAIWFAAVLWWRQAGAGVHMPTPGLLLVGALPLAWLLSNLVARRGRRNTAIMPPQAHAAPSRSTDTTAGAGAAIAGCWSACIATDLAQEFAAVLATRRIRPTPDDIMLDEDGLAIPTGRVASLDPGAMHAMLAQLQMQAGGREAAPVRDAVARALALLDKALAPALANWPLAGRGADIDLAVKLILPRSFSAAECDLAMRYARARLHVAMDKIAVLASDSGIAALEQIHEAGLGLPDAGRKALLLLACDSTLSPDAVARLRDTRRLFEPRRPEGLMPGEAAFAVLCASDAALSAAGIDSDTCCRFTSLRSARRADAAEASSGVSHEELAQAFAGALDDAGITGANIAGIACDADHRLSRTLESLGAIAAHVPHLYDIRHRLATNEACGHVGAASALAALVAGVAQAGRVPGPVLVFSISHPVDRAAAVLVAPRRQPSSLHHQAA